MKLLKIIIILASFCLSFAKSIQAQTIMSNDQYEIHMGTLNSFSGKIKDISIKTNLDIAKLAPGIFSGPNYIASVGMPSSITSASSVTKPFSFSISSLFVDFGPINPGSPLIRTNVIDASGSDTNGYSIVTYQDHPLLSETGEIIPDTTCDNGDCDEIRAATWLNILTFGFGYRCDNMKGSSCLTDFYDNSYFKKFPSMSSNETSATIMRGETASKATSEITYKINVSPTYKNANYKNTITFIALPSL